MTDPVVGMELEQTDVAMPEGEYVTGGHPRGALVIDPHPGKTRHPPADHDRRDVERLDRPSVRVAEGRCHDDDAGQVGVLAEPREHVRPTAVIPDAEQHQIAARALQRRHHGTDGLGIEPLRRISGDQGDELAGPAVPGHPITQFGGNALDAEPSGGGHRGHPPQGARHGRGGHTGVTGDVSNRRASKVLAGHSSLDWSADRDETSFIIGNRAIRGVKCATLSASETAAPTRRTSCSIDEDS